VTDLTVDALADLPGPPWLVERRRAALDDLDPAALPTPEEEIWRYSRIDELDLAWLSRLGGVPADLAPRQLPPAASSLMASMVSVAGAAVVRNGRVDGVELRPVVADAGVLVGDVGEVPASRELLGSVARSPDHFVRMNDAFMADALVIDVPPNLQLDAPLVVCHLVGGDPVSVFPRLVVRVGAGARVDVVEIIASGPGAGLAVPVTELSVGGEANVGYTAVQLMGERWWHVGYQVSEVGRDASLTAATVAFGGDYARTRADSRLVGTGASGEMLAAYFASGTQMHDFRTLQEHDAPRTRSDLLFKGAVSDDARSVYSGLIRVRRGATQTDAFQTNRNLVLSEGARAHSVPNLDIEENDVRCSHASAVGPIDEEQRYYLETRGVPPGAADRLIALGFFDEVLDRLSVGTLRASLREELVSKVDSWSRAARESGANGRDRAGDDAPRRAAGDA
jgi:Fe-S cluster assembly protein SufD